MPRYPDPERVFRTVMWQPPLRRCFVTSMNSAKLYPDHKHQAFVDSSGNGQTDIEASHFHYVRDGRVVVDPSDGHAHMLTRLPCAAG